MVVGESQKIAKAFRRQKHIGSGKYKIDQGGTTGTIFIPKANKRDGEGESLESFATSFETEEAGHPKPPHPQC